jgi:hypothetical protein
VAQPRPTSSVIRLTALWNFGKTGAFPICLPVPCLRVVGGGPTAPRRPTPTRPRTPSHGRLAACWGWLGVTRAVWGVCCVGLSAQSQWSASGEKWVGVGVTLVLACPGRLPDAAVATLCGG